MTTGTGDGPPRDETVRDAIRRVLADGPRTLRELSADVGVSERDLPEHLEHVQRSLSASGDRLVVEPPTCRRCGFTFTPRPGLKRPGKCPSCRGTYIAPPRARVE